MARPIRIEYEGACYHITARGNERKEIYFGKEDYAKFKEYLKEAQEKYGYILHCYVFMTNHYHLLIETPMPNLKEIMHYINGAYTNFINIKRRRSGHLFQGRYKAILVDKDAYLLELSRYLHLNPVRAKIVERPQDYHYSSYGAYISKNKEDVVHRDLIWDMVATNGENAPQKYKEFVERAIPSDTDLENPLKNVYGGLILGNTGFIKDALNRLGLDDLKRKEISNRRELIGAYKIDEIIDTLCAHLYVERTDLFSKNNGKDYRNITIYLLKKHTGITNGELGQLLGGISYSAVSKAFNRFSERLESDSHLRKRVDTILSNVKG